MNPYLCLYIKPEERALIEKAAGLLGLTVNAYLRRISVTDSKAVIENPSMVKELKDKWGVA